MIRKYGSAILVIVLVLCTGGCGADDKITDQGRSDSQITVTREDPEEAEDTNIADTDISEDMNAEEPKILVFRDVFGEEYQTEIKSDIEPSPYSKELFVHEDNSLTYNDDGYDCLLGVDVSHHQGKVDWKAVKDQGYDFTFLRIAYRGYGKEGSLNPDKTFEQNYEGAKEAGLSVGVYFFAQAINETEAAEEAEYVLNILNGRDLELPVVYDPESILDDEARTDNVTAEQFTKNSRVFCDKIRDSGYKPMIYCNMLWEAFQLDLSELKDIPVWYADYEDAPQTPYNFEFWQYSNEGSVKGIDGAADLNIWMRHK